ncbi:hypothetical protein FKP32DRAFT_109788 [Trametes sanguinea]|nr:hypothetical protein FKP32DRAFT_109788 [Trametes sanguinea]
MPVLLHPHLLDVPRHHSSIKSSTIPMNKSSATRVALYHYDILVYIFDIFESRWRGAGRRTLASCALVCRAWSGPASQVLWRVLDSLHPLWALLAGLNFPPSAKGLTEFWEIVDPEEFVKQIATNESERWQRFLHRATHVREIGVASCGEAELALIRAILLYNGGKTFLPTLHTLSWRHNFPPDTTLLSFVSPYLKGLELSTTRSRQFSPFGYASTPAPDNDYTQSEPLFAGLPAASPNLSRLVVSSRHLPGSVLLPHLPRFLRMRELLLFGSLCSLAPSDVLGILEAMPELEVLSAPLRDYDMPEHAASTTSLQDLRVNGAARDLAGFLSRGLHAPSLHTLMITIDGNTYTASHQHCITALSNLRFASSLRKLRLITQTYDDETQAQLPIPFYPTVIQPLSALRHLEALDLRILNTLFRVSEEDLLAVAQAWPRLRSLALAYVPVSTVPPLRALRHFAEHCPDLRELTLTKLDLSEIANLEDHVPTTLASRPPHPLQQLELRVTWGVTPAVDDKAAKDIARFLDALFPNIELQDQDKREEPGLGSFMSIKSFFVSWERIMNEIRALRSERMMRSYG